MKLEKTQAELLAEELQEKINNEPRTDYLTLPAVPQPEEVGWAEKMAAERQAILHPKTAETESKVAVGEKHQVLIEMIDGKGVISIVPGGMQKQSVVAEAEDTSVVTDEKVMLDLNKDFKSAKPFDVKDPIV